MKMLVIVDMLKDFCTKDGVLATSPITGKLYAEDIITPIAKLLKDFREKGGVVVWVNDAHAPDDKEFEIWPAHAVKGTDGAQIIDELVPGVVKDGYFEHVLEKTRYSGFFETGLHGLVDVVKPESATVVGVCTSICVMDTVGGFANRDIDVVVPKNCVADFDPKMHEMCLERMKNIYQAKVE